MLKQPVVVEVVFQFKEINMGFKRVIRTARAAKRKVREAAVRSAKRK